ncbi:hypothetical protein F0562_034215 [Nyssa sinensis]|uniref:Uncharacterized protein n=1 Tax=Nyssa sinensis TaxID=561372 RepID=A0A5J5AF37_9ASTE|nr:hypothetical protein F0562_034215 [Nyssa sinensis]
MEMSENYDKERVLGDAGAVENVGEEGFSNDFVHVESSAETSQVPPVADGAAGSADGGEVSVIIESVDVADSPDSVNQVEHVDQDNGVLVTTADSVQVDPDDVKVMDDGGKEDMFVDCPEELVVHDRVNPDNKETMTIPETEQPPDEKDDVQEIQTYELDNGRQVQDLMDELNHLQAMLEKTVGEKESFARKYEEEKEAFTKEVANLHHQLKALNEQQSLFTKDDGESVDHLRKAEIGEGEEKILVSDTPLREMMINECFKFLKSALDERLQTEGTCRELQAILFMKDQEIEDLHANIAEFSLSQDVVVSFLNSTQEGWSQSLKALSGFQLEKDQHIEAIAGRVLTSLATAVNQEELFDESVTGKMSHVEKSTSILIEKYNQFLSEMDLLRQCLTEGKQDHCVQDKLQTIIVAACDELIELRRKEVDLAQKISHLEDENVKLVEQLDKDGKMVEMANVEIGKLKVELEQEKTKYANTKEKLSLAVTKGKALVQQRDMLKQSLAEKTSELEKCLIELQEKSSALQVAELSKEELLKSENLATSLQEALSQKDAILEKCEEILSETGAPEELQSVNVTERIRWIVDERNVLNGVSLEFQKLSSALSLIQTTENVSSLDLESQVSWLVESFSRAQVEATRLQDEISRTKEAAHNDIDCLTTSLLAEIQEKNYLQEELEDLTLKYQGIVEKEHQVSLEKDLMVNMLLEASGITMDGQEEVNQPPSDVAMLIDKCFRKVKEERNAVSESSLVEAEMFERIQTLLYLRDQELMLCEKILEEEMLDRLEVKNLSSELRVISQELQALNDEKGSLHKDFERAEEKSALLREKLSMAVKKGKGLVQERENLKHLLDEKNAEIEKLELELQQQESAFGDCRDQLNKLSDDVERIPKLEADLVAMKDQRDQLEQFLMESNNMLQRVIDSIDSIALPLDSNFEEPVEKVEWLAGYLNECRVAKLRAEQELDKVEVETNTLASKLAEAYKTMKSLEDAMSLADNNISQLVEEKRALEISKTYVEQELQKAMEEASIQTGKFSEVCATRKSLEDALSLAENKISVLINEKEDAQISRAAAESEVEKVEEEVSIQTSKLAEAYRTIKVLEDALSQVETNVSLLSEEHNNAQVGRTNLENEIRKLKEEADSQTSKLADACSTIKRLEDALSKAETNISELVGEKKNAEQEVSTLNSKLNACLEELAGTHGSLESRSLELSGHLNSLQLFLKDETLFSLLRQSFERNFESLKNMDFLFEDIKGHFVEMGLEMLQNHSFAEDFYASKLVSAGFENIGNVEMHNGELNEADGDNIASYFTKAVEEFNMRNKILTDEAKGFFTCMNEFIAALSSKITGNKG